MYRHIVVVTFSAEEGVTHTEAENVVREAVRNYAAARTHMDPQSVTATAVNAASVRSLVGSLYPEIDLAQRGQGETL